MQVVLENAGSYSVDILLPAKNLVVEVADRTALVKSGKLGFRPSGFSMLRHRQMTRFGYGIISIPFDKWQQSVEDGTQTGYLQQLLENDGPLPGPAQLESG